MRSSLIVIVIMRSSLIAMLVARALGDYTVQQVSMTEASCAAGAPFFTVSTNPGCSVDMTSPFSSSTACVNATAQVMSVYNGGVCAGD